MRVVKFIFACVIATMACLCFTSCSKEYSSPLKGQVVNDLTFDSSQSSKSVSIADADLTGFTINSSELWCTAAAQSKALNITVQANDTYDDRQATVTVTDPEDQTSISFKVFQKQNDAILIDGSTFVVPEEGGDINIKIQSNVNYEVEIPASAPWLTESTKALTRGLVSSTIVLTAERNNSGEEREALVTFIDKESGVSSKITIKQSLTPYIEIEENQITLSEDEKEIEIVVKTNINLETVISNDWITDNGRESNGDFNFTQKLKVSKNNSGDEREAIVTFEDKKNGLTSEITIKQSLTPYIEIDKNEFNMDELGGEVKVTVTSNIAVDVKFSDDWISSAGTTDKGDFNFVQIIKVNSLPSDKDKRTATITFTDKLGKWNLSKVATVNQTLNLSLKESDVEIMVGKSHTLEVINNTGSSLSWKSSNTSVATVNSSGTVTGVSEGSATITVTSSDGKYSAKCTVTVKDITSFVTAKSTGGSVMILNDLVQNGSKLNWSFINNTSETVKLKSMQLVDGVNGQEGNIMDVNADVAAGSSVGYTTTIGLAGIHIPVTCRFRYEYNGKEYMTTAVYDSVW